MGFCGVWCVSGGKGTWGRWRERERAARIGFGDRFAYVSGTAGQGAIPFTRVWCTVHKMAISGLSIGERTGSRVFLCILIVCTKYAEFGSPGVQEIG